MKNDKKNHFWGDYHIIKRILLFQRSFFRDNPRGKAAGVSAMMANTNISSSLAAAGDGAHNWLDGATFDWRSKVSWLSAHSLRARDKRAITSLFGNNRIFIAPQLFEKSENLFIFPGLLSLSILVLFTFYITLSSSLEQSCYCSLSTLKSFSFY